MGKVKAKDHYVQQEYLRNFKLKHSESKISCYDFEKNEVRPSENILNCAHENGFLNLDIDKYLECIEKENVKLVNSKANELIKVVFENPRMMDEFLTNHVEIWLKDVKKISDYYNMRNVLSEFNGLGFLTAEEKYNISMYIAYQYLRTKAFRKYLCDVAISSNEAKEEFESYTTQLKKAVTVLIHIKFLMHNKLIQKMANLIYKGNWTIGINNSSQTLLTSDNPVTLVRDPKLFDCHFFAGIETISYPLSSKMILIIVNPKNNKFTEFNGKYTDLTSEAISYYNKQQALCCNRYIYGESNTTVEKVGNKYKRKKKVSLKEINDSLLSINDREL